MNKNENKQKESIMDMLDITATLLTNKHIYLSPTTTQLESHPGAYEALYKLMLKQADTTQFLRELSDLGEVEFFGAVAAESLGLASFRGLARCLENICWEKYKDEIEKHLIELEKPDQEAA